VDQQAAITKVIESAAWQGVEIDASEAQQWIQSMAAEVEELMLDENRDWFALVRFHDFELHV